MNIDRRKAILNLSMSAVGLAFTPAFLSALTSCEPKKGVSTLFTFSADQDVELQALTECIIPTTDTPGAIAAGVNRFIDQVLAQVTEEGEKTTFMQGLEELMKACSETYGKPFSHLEDAEKTTLLTKMEAEDAPFFGILKAMTITGYYTSEIGATQELAYVHATGFYDGNKAYSEVGKSYF